MRLAWLAGVNEESARELIRLFAYILYIKHYNKKKLEESTRTHKHTHTYTQKADGKTGNRGRILKVSNDDLCCSKVASFYSKSDGLKLGVNPKPPGEGWAREGRWAGLVGRAIIFFRKIFSVRAILNVAADCLWKLCKNNLFFVILCSLGLCQFKIYRKIGLISKNKFKIERSSHWLGRRRWWSPPARLNLLLRQVLFINKCFEDEWTAR